MEQCVLEHIFKDNFSQVLLMQKNRPDWQKVKLNGIGGKIEKGEPHVEAMVREMFEEIGLERHIDEWQEVGEIKGEDWITYVFTAIFRETNDAPFSKTDEEVNWYEVNNLRKIIISNLTWHIHIYIDMIKNKSPKHFTARY
ncbi:MAG: NUDIX domain-containing protein [Candidatus Roizmanbacteria bacterium]